MTSFSGGMPERNEPGVHLRPNTVQAARRMQWAVCATKLGHQYKYTHCHARAVLLVSACVLFLSAQGAWAHLQLVAGQEQLHA
jgi:hypothetical protein